MATLILEDGTTFKGRQFGASMSVSGEIVFQTGMVGYPEALTDPSYRCQLLTLTYPLVGNYGVIFLLFFCGRFYLNERSLNSDKTHCLICCCLVQWFESYKIHAAALIIGELSESPSHWSSAKSLDQWLKECKLFNLMLQTVSIFFREGTMLGKLIRNLVREVSMKVTHQDGSFHITVVDCGIKYNQIRCLAQRGARVTVVPWDHPLDTADFDGLFVSNGPGIPSSVRPPSTT
uniref:Carbamoyl-phosphate synthase small subunit N-terminal domain-containing protein n=1 Tax=Maylandia zebra TaxID=106582 RepID=A0A3P9C6M3_9CICH